MITKAELKHVDIVHSIVKETITEIYMKYYPQEVVRFFLILHSRSSVKKDIEDGKTFIISCDGEIVGTGTVDGNRIGRIFVLPQYEGRGLGSKLIDFLEMEVLKEYGSVVLDSMLPAADFYRKRNYEKVKHVEHVVAKGKILSYEVMCKRDFGVTPEGFNAPEKLVEREAQLQGLDLEEVRKKTPTRVYILADSLFDTMVERNVGEMTFDFGGGIYVMNHNDKIGFVKGEMCSPGIATQAEDLYAAGVEELIHVGFAGGNQIGDYVISNGAYHDTAIAGLYGFSGELMESTPELTETFCKEMEEKGLNFTRGYHWTTDAGYVQPEWRQRYFLKDKEALCVEMEGAGLFTVAKFRSRKATAIYLISDSGSDENWKLGWGEEVLEKSIQRIIDALI
ncbi:MAG: GNAT family N-acetyltransferase [Eubacterium sp.]|nr:GNAT family N-acetyltransferase [Eubacterium sp.]